MIPILYPENENSFTSEGLGRLSDALSCVVAEERNGKYDLSMTYPLDGQHWSDIAHSRIIYAKPADGKRPQPFRIYRIGKPLNGRCSVYAQHISYHLSFIPVMPFTASGFSASLNGLVTNAAETCPFTVWTDKTTSGDFTVAVPTSFRSLLGGANGSLLDVFGTAEYEFDKYAVKAHVNRGTDRGVVLRYGKNITDLEQEENIQNTITGICPYWLNRNAGTCKTLPEKVLWSSNAGNFPFKRTVPVDFSSEFETEPTEAQLRAAGNAYITNNNIGVPEVSIRLSFVPLWQSEEYKDLANIERVNLCDPVTVVYEKLGVSTTAKVVATEYDVLKERYVSIDIGTVRTTLAKATVQAQNDTEEEISKSESALEQYVNYQTQLITGGKGGFIIFKYNASGFPEEMLIMDTASESTATNIIRLNKNGIGFSTDGGVTYSNAWTIDGHLNADFITTGTLLGITLNGDTIIGGTITGTLITSTGTYPTGVTGTLTMNAGTLKSVGTGNNVNVEGVFEASGVELVDKSDPNDVWKVTIMPDLMQYSAVDQGKTTTISPTGVSTDGNLTLGTTSLSEAQLQRLLALI